VCGKAGASSSFTNEEEVEDGEMGETGGLLLEGRGY
jgi:hypothetical protein